MSELDPRVGEAVDHLQKAALEMIAAMRNALDVAEDLVGDPAALNGAFNLFQTGITTVMANVYRDSGQSNVNVSTNSADPDIGAHATDGRVERITVD